MVPPNGVVVAGVVVLAAPNVNGVAAVPAAGAVLVVALPKANGVAPLVVVFVDDWKLNIFLE